MRLTIEQLRALPKEVSIKGLFARCKAQATTKNGVVYVDNGWLVNNYPVWQNRDYTIESMSEPLRPTVTSDLKSIKVLGDIRWFCDQITLNGEKMIFTREYKAGRERWPGTDGYDGDAPRLDIDLYENGDNVHMGAMFVHTNRADRDVIIAALNAAEKLKVRK